MGSIKVVVQRPGEISHVIYINKEYFIGECNRWVGGLSTDIMTDCGLHLVIHARTPYSSGKNLSTPFGLIYSTVLMIAKDDAGQPVSLTPEQVQTARSWLLRHSF